ncbi:DUF692 domain-containing protein [Pseudoteredinibacter isoporae]|uniref:DUF692 domain-containing protein n=1 Tax=Pseudoteredinibacter isoporae TaxID=570281 RepID=UPI00310468B3
MLPSQASIALRHQYMDALIEQDVRLPWMEVLADNFLNIDNLHFYRAEPLFQHCPLSLHCIGMNLGAMEALNEEYLHAVKLLADRLDAKQVSDHVCFHSLEGAHSYDLLPIAYHPENVRYLAGRLSYVQRFLGRPFCVENISSYLFHRQSVLSEGQFLAGLAELSGCGILLDVNNLYVNGLNLSNDPEAAKDYALQQMAELNAEQVWQIHIAGHQRTSWGAIDHHGAALHEDVLTLLFEATRLYGRKPVLLEWDHNIPPLERVLDELNVVSTVLSAVEREPLGVE